MLQQDRIGAVIIGAGSSERMGKDKICLPVAGKPLLAWSVDVCQHYQNINQIILVLNETNIQFGRQLALQRKWSKVTDICLGGQRRQDSVISGIQHLDNCGWIIIQDAARPFLSPQILNAGLELVYKTGTAVAAVPVKDTIKQTNASRIVERTLDRKSLWAAQTPQIFRSDIILKAYDTVTSEETDDASMVEKSGGTVHLFMGSYNNIKITTPEDWLAAETIAREFK